MNTRRSALVGAVLVAAGAGFSCGLRQNLRNEFLSFRGAWFCEKKNCELADMKRSAKGTDEGGVRILYGKMQPTAALVFNAGADVETFSATVTDCKGKSMDIDDASLKAPGKHGISAESDSWLVILDKGELGELTLKSKGKCAKLVVSAQAKWPKGTSYEDKGGISAQ